MKNKLKILTTLLVGLIKYKYIDLFPKILDNISDIYVHEI